MMWKKDKKFRRKLTSWTTQEWIGYFSSEKFVKRRVFVHLGHFFVLFRDIGKLIDKHQSLVQLYSEHKTKNLSCLFNYITYLIVSVYFLAFFFSLPFYASWLLLRAVACIRTEVKRFPTRQTRQKGKINVVST